MSALYNSANPSVLALKKLSDRLDDLKNANPGEATANLRALQESLGEELQHTGLVMDSVVGILIEKHSLGGMDTADAEEHLRDLGVRKDLMVGEAQKISAMMKEGSVPDSDWLFYFDRVKQFGEQSANTWMIQRYPR